MIRSDSNADSSAPSIVAIGGGTGLSMLLRSLKPALKTGEIGELTAIVTVTDDGGSSGRLRNDYGIVAPGDIRNCLVALADDEDFMGRLFQYRFPGDDGLGGHSFGNLFMAAVTGVTGDFYESILAAERVLSISGKVLPATLGDVRLRGTGERGGCFTGESAVGASQERIVHLELVPGCPPAFEPAVRAIGNADLVLLGPGSLFTSVLPNLLVPGIREALAHRPCRSVALLNLMTQPGETSHMDGLAHVEALEQHAGVGLVDLVLANDAAPPPGSLYRYAEVGAEPVGIERLASSRYGEMLVVRDLLGGEQFVRHDAAKLRGAILELAAGAERPHLVHAR